MDKRKFKEKPSFNIYDIYDVLWEAGIKYCMTTWNDYDYKPIIGYFVTDRFEEANQIFYDTTEKNPSRQGATALYISLPPSITNMYFYDPLYLKTLLKDEERIKQKRDQIEKYLNTKSVSDAKQIDDYFSLFKEGKSVCGIDYNITNIRHRTVALTYRNSDKFNRFGGVKDIIAFFEDSIKHLSFLVDLKVKICSRENDVLAASNDIEEIRRIRISDAEKQNALASLSKILNSRYSNPDGNRNAILSLLEEMENSGFYGKTLANYIKNKTSSANVIEVLSVLLCYSFFDLHEDPDLTRTLLVQTISECFSPALLSYLRSQMSAASEDIIRSNLTEILRYELPISSSFSTNNKKATGNYSDILNCIENNNHTRIVGIGGVGKSFVMKKLFTENSKNENYTFVYLPVSVLNEYKKQDKEIFSPLKFMLKEKYHSDIANLILDCFEKENEHFVFLLDGINEISNEYRRSLYDYFDSKKCKIVVSARSMEEDDIFSEYECIYVNEIEEKAFTKILESNNIREKYMGVPRTPLFLSLILTQKSNELSGYKKWFSKQQDVEALLWNYMVCEMSKSKQVFPAMFEINDVVLSTYIFFFVPYLAYTMSKEGYYSITYENINKSLSGISDDSPNVLEKKYMLKLNESLGIESFLRSLPDISIYEVRDLLCSYGIFMQKEKNTSETYYSFYHQIIQEYLAQFFVKQVIKAELSEGGNLLFPERISISSHSDIFRGLFEDEKDNLLNAVRVSSDYLNKRIGLLLSLADNTISFDSLNLSQTNDPDIRTALYQNKSILKKATLSAINFDINEQYGRKEKTSTAILYTEMYNTLVTITDDGLQRCWEINDNGISLAEFPIPLSMFEEKESHIISMLANSSPIKCNKESFINIMKQDARDAIYHNLEHSRNHQNPLFIFENSLYNFESKELFVFSSDNAIPFKIPSTVKIRFLHPTHEEQYHIISAFTLSDLGNGLKTLIYQESLSNIHLLWTNYFDYNKFPFVSDLAFGNFIASQEYKTIREFVEETCKETEERYDNEEIYSNEFVTLAKEYIEHIENPTPMDIDFGKIYGNLIAAQMVDSNKITIISLNRQDIFVYEIDTQKQTLTEVDNFISFINNDDKIITFKYLKNLASFFLTCSNGKIIEIHKFTNKYFIREILGKHLSTVSNIIIYKDKFITSDISGLICCRKYSYFDEKAFIDFDKNIATRKIVPFCNFDTSNCLSFDDISSYYCLVSPDFNTRVLTEDIFKNELESLIPREFVIKNGTILAYMGNRKIIHIPPHVKEIGKYAFAGKDIHEVYLPSSVKLVNDGAFEQCTLLSLVHFENGLEEIGISAFQNCGITDLILPESIKRLNPMAFISCIHLQKVVVLGDALTIGDCCFSGCINLISFSSFSRVKEIGQHAFSNCGFDEIHLPNSVEKIGTNAFSFPFSYINIFVAGNTHHNINKILGDRYFYLGRIFVEDNCESLNLAPFIWPTKKENMKPRDIVIPPSLKIYIDIHGKKHTIPNNEEIILVPPSELYIQEDESPLPAYLTPLRLIRSTFFWDNQI